MFFHNSLDLDKIPFSYFFDISKNGFSLWSKYSGLLSAIINTSMSLPSLASFLATEPKMQTAFRLFPSFFFT